jgi:predicted DCC family thiol-disulfide oxidoreductase YuxK
METVVKTADNQSSWTIVSDDSCPVVRFMTHLVKTCDNRRFFRFIGRENADDSSRALLGELSATQWSLLLIDDAGHRMQGPEAIPYILKNLPSGRLACVAYLLPGTMWLTEQLYHGISHNRRKIAKLTVSSSGNNGTGKHAA